MTSTLRAQAAAAAVRECPLFLASCDRSCSGKQIAICERNDAASYALGHAAGVSEGARRFAEWLDETGHDIAPSGVVGVTLFENAGSALDRFLSSLAPGTGLATVEKENNEDKETK